MRLRKSLAVGGAAAVALFAVGQANALTITNRDSVEHRLEVQEGEERSMTWSVVIPAGQSVEICREDCRITMDSGQSGQFEGTEVVEISDGAFVTNR